MFDMLFRNLANLALPLLAAGFASGQQLALEPVVEGLVQTNGLYTAPGDMDRLFVMTTVGTITVIENGIVLPDPFLDIQPILFPGRGLMSMAFHPDYQNNGRFFVVYQAGDLTTSLVEYQVSSNPNVADPASALVILGPVPQTTNQHPWNQLLFAPDGMLLLANGDNTNPGFESNKAQDLGSLSGKILRLNIDLPAPFIPADNPFVGLSGAREEIWQYGLRQPWRVSIDTGTDDLYISDVGFMTTEEINVLPAGSSGGLNFGWRCFEGSECGNLGDCVPTCGDSTWVQPDYEYTHDNGRCAVIGGFVYRGSAIPSFQGRYLFADFCGGLYSMRYEGGQLIDLIDHSAELTAPDGSPIPAICSFGQDQAGELYLVSLLGSIHKLIPGDGISTYCQTSPNSIGPGALIGSTGTASISAQDFGLVATGAIPDQFGMFFYGPQVAMQPEGDGILCVGGGLFRILPAESADSLGVHSRLLDFSSPPNPAGTITAGSTWNFQLWYRDPNGPGGNAYNFSDALQVQFQP